MLQQCLIFLILNLFTTVLSKYETNNINSQNAITTKTYAIWQNATVPFYVNPAHFDHEQTLAILSTLSMFAFKTCIKFKPVMARPYPTDEVMVFINPDGTKRCLFETKGHSVFNPHFVNLGYECIKSPMIDMLIMRALGFPFEHNRDSRDLYIDVLNENIEPGNIELFTKEDVLPLELRFLPYDVNSVMHFGTRDYSKNGHRTILFKDSSVQQNRVGLTEIDIKKIEIVYGPECRARDRQEKIELCQSYPGVARRKRQTDDNALENKEPTPESIQRKKRDIDPDEMVTKSLRVNPNITPPPFNQSEDISKSLKELGIEEAVENIVDEVYKVSSLALKNARVKYCNDTKDNPPGDVKIAREGEEKDRNSSDILGIIELVADFAKNMVDHAVKNLTKFCENSEALEVYQRYSCNLGGRDPRCRDTYRSTKFGAVRYSTQHRPIMAQYTSHKGGYKPKNFGREGNVTEKAENPTTLPVRRKRDLDTAAVEPDDKGEPKSKTADKEVGLVKKEAIDEKTNENKERAEDNKGKAIEAETDDIKAKSEENNMLNKEVLRMKTMIPGLDRNRYDRRTHGDDSEHFDASTEDLDNKDTILAKKIIKKKHIIQKNNRKEDRHRKDTDMDVDEIPQKVQKKIRQTKKKLDKFMAIPIELGSEFSGETIKGDSEISKEDYREKEELEPLKPKNKKRIVKKKIYQEESDAEEYTMKEPASDYEERPPISPTPKKHSVDTEVKGRGRPRTVALSKKNKDFYNERRWPKGELIYMIQVDTTYDLSDMRSRLAEVRDILKERTCVKLKEIKPGEANKYEDYILIDNSPDYVTGRVGGKQKFGSIELFRGGQHRQHAAMMVMAMLGFYFEVSRHDRDKYIRVHMRHVRPDKLHHFEMIRADATLPLPYDYASATHPAWQFWRQIGRAGISTVATFKQKDPDGRVMKSLGQNKKILSDIDIVKINSVYGINCFKHVRAITDTLGLNNENVPLPEVEE